MSEVGSAPVAAGAVGARAVADVLERAARDVAVLVGGAARWPGHERHGVLRRLDRAIDALTTARAALLVVERDAGSWRGSGVGSFEAWRAQTGRAGQRVAGAQIRQAEHLAAAPVTAAAAVADGAIGVEHAAVIGKVAATGSPAQQVAIASTAVQEQLLALAQQVDAGTFATAVARWAAEVDPDGCEADHQAQRRERFLQVSDTPRGTFVKGRLDRMAGHRLRLALEAVTARPAADDDRDHGQRCADALSEMADRVLCSADTKPGAHVPPHVSLILTERTWTAARAERDRRRAAARVTRTGRVSERDRAVGTATAPPLTTAPDAGHGHGYPPATLEDGTPVPASEVALVLCDCDITRITIDADAVPVDLGRTRRLFTHEQRRAVIARDRGCVWPDCHMPARWAQIHHIRWWERDTGPTTIDNAALLCSYHHHETHRLDLTLTRSPSGAEEGRRRRPPGPPQGTRVPTHGSPRGNVAVVTYEFRDPAGRLVGGPDARTSPTAVTHPDSAEALLWSNPTDRVDLPTTRAGG